MKGWSSQLNPPSTDRPQPDETEDGADEVAICNPAHPLYGRRFRLHRRCETPGREPFVQVFYTEEILLRVPAWALTEPQEPPSKLSLSSVAELVSTFQVVSACPPPKRPSGPPSRTP